MPPEQIHQIVQWFATKRDTKSFFLYDTIDPAAYRIWQIRLSVYQPTLFHPNWKRIGYFLGKMLIESLQWGRLWFRLQGLMGYAYRPYFWHELARENSLSCTIVSSLYMEYRYHVILRKEG